MILVSSEEELFELEGVLEEKKVVMGGWKRLRLEDMVVVVLASWDAIMRLVNGDSKKFTESWRVWSKRTCLLMFLNFCKLGVTYGVRSICRRSTE